MFWKIKQTLFGAMKQAIGRRCGRSVQHPKRHRMQRSMLQRIVQSIGQRAKRSVCKKCASEKILLKLRGIGRVGMLTAQRKSVVVQALLQDSLLDRMKHPMLRSMLDVKWKPSQQCVFR